MTNYEKERKILSQLYANKADSVKYLPFFFKDKKELIRFFNTFSGKTLKIPDTFEEFMKFCFYDTENKPISVGIDDRIHQKVKDKILQTYLNLYDRLSDVIQYEISERKKTK